MRKITTCDLPSRNDAIHLNKQGWTSNNLILSKRIRWYTRSKPFLKSAKNQLAQQFPRCSALSVRCRRYMMACCVAIPAIANCLGSRCSVMPERTLESVNTSRILVVNHNKSKQTHVLSCTSAQGRCPIIRHCEFLL